MSFESSFVALFAVATAVAVVAARLRIPYTIALVLAGLGLGAGHVLHPPHLTKDLLYAVFLPGLIFEASFHLDGKRFLENAVTIGALSVPGVLISGAILAPLLSFAVRHSHVANGFGLAPSLVFAALIVATDPIAVVSLFKSLGVNPKLSTLVDGESIFNDGTAVAFFTVVLAATSGQGLSIVGAIGDFLVIAGVGLMVGGVFGFLTARFARRTDDVMVHIMLTTIAAYGSFVAAEGLHASGVIATATAGLVSSPLFERVQHKESDRIAVRALWEYLAFALNSVVFLLIGITVPLGRLVGSWKLILLGWLAVTLTRALLVFGTTAIVRPTRFRIPWSWAMVLSWGGLRGALSMVLALSLPFSLVDRELIETLTFGVVVVSILVQGLTMTPLVRALGVSVVE